MGKLRSFAVVVATLAAAACAEVAGTSASPLLFADDGMPLGRLENRIVPTRYALALTIDPSEERFSGTATISVAVDRPTQAIWMHGLGLEVAEAVYIEPDGKRIAARWEQRSDTGSALLTLSESARPGPADITIAYSAAFNTSSFGLFRQQRDGRWYAATQLEDTGARMVFPSFDEPGFKVPFAISVTARTNDVVVTNTPEILSLDQENGWTLHEFEPTDPFPTYLVALIVGPYDVVLTDDIAPNAIREHGVPLRGVAVAGLGGRLHYALDHTPPMIDYLEEFFGTPYPFAKLDLIAMPSSFGGAMENAGAITYDEFILLMDEDSPLSQRRIYTYIHAHELAHMWFGDLVTPAWWDDIWLNEAFADWLMTKVAQDVWPEGEFERQTLRNALGTMREDSLASARRIREPVLRDGEISDAFDAITYDKGAGVLAMFEAYVGEERFRDGVRAFVDRFTHKSATSDDFMAAIAEASGDAAIVPALQSFLDQPGVPLVAARLECAADQAPVVHVAQSRYRPLGSAIDASAQTWRIPTCIAYSADGAVGRTCEIVSAQEQIIALDAESCPSSIHPNAGGAGYYRFTLDQAGWTALIADAERYSASEALVLVDSLGAAFRAGEASADDYVAGMAALAQHPAWDVVQAVATNFSATNILEEGQLDAVRPQLAALFRDRYEAIASAEDGGDVLLLNTLTSFLAFTAEDPELRGELTSLAALRTGIRGRPDWSYVDRERLGLVMAVGVQELDARFFDLLLGETLASNDAAFRRDALAALARADDPALAARLRETLLDERLRGNEALGVLGAQLSRPETRVDAGAWITANGDAVIELSPEAFRAQNVPNLGSAFCATDQSAEFAAFIESHAAAMPGYERSLAQAQESAALCAAFKAAAADDLAAALSRLQE